MNSLTTIPIEVLFAIIGGLITIVGALGSWIGNGIVREIRSLRQESNARGVQLTKQSTILAVICNKLGIPYNSD